MKQKYIIKKIEQTLKNIIINKQKEERNKLNTKCKHKTNKKQTLKNMKIYSS